MMVFSRNFCCNSLMTVCLLLTLRAVVVEFSRVCCMCPFAVGSGGHVWARLQKDAVSEKPEFLPKGRPQACTRGSEPKCLSQQYKG